MDKCWCGNRFLEEYSQDYFVCHKCGTLITKSEFKKNMAKVDDEENDLYGSNYWEKKMLKISGTQTFSELIQQYLGGRVPYWIQYIIKYIPLNSTVAEVGCGLGQLSYVLKYLGYQETAYEISPQICSFLKKKMKLNVICGEFGCINEVYEAILSFDLLEHLMEPRIFVKECRERLRGVGIFCCQTPCYTEEWSYEEMLKHKPEFAKLLVPEQHIYIFSKRSITKLLREAGFEYINFEQPAFGEYYDMFLFASLNPIKEVQIKEEVDLEVFPNLLMVQTLIDFFNRLNNL